ncbi:MAG: NADH-quinone oxidoreductase subunit B, partial [Desulfobacterota bacterium]|nr:NADH-quinone oxidoreductase subunit B [Thermodesulfobacteriota bacterium]
MGFIKSFIAKARGKSPWLLHYDCGSCNGCDIEVL